MKDTSSGINHKERRRISRGLMAGLATIALTATGSMGALAASIGGQDTQSADQNELLGAVSWTVEDPDHQPVGGTGWQIETTDEETGVDEDPAPTEEPSEETAGTESDQDPMSLSEPIPLADGPDGGNAPYVYWDVRDENNVLVPGATFTFQARIQGRNNWTWTTGTDAGGITDCDGTCSTNSSGNVLDRDGDGGEFLLEHRGTPRTGNNSATNRITSGTNYRVSQGTAPAGYEWVQSGQNTQTIGQTNGNSATWNGDTHKFGTFTVKKKEPIQISCAAGYVYAVSEAGQLQQVAPGGAVTNVGTSAGTTYFNGLGIGSDGSPIYGIQRSSDSGTSQNATVWEFSRTTGTWTSTTLSTSALGGNTGTNMVAGAVNLATGKYYFGGFTSNGNFKVYEYDPTKATNKITLKGTVVTSLNSSANGDMAFDALGNLYIVHGDGANTTIYSVTAANFNAATGGNITSAKSASFQTMNNVNGVAFDATGRAFLGSSGIIRSYAMPDWSGEQSVVSTGLSSTDLAGCASPPSITIQKEVVGGRNVTSDQFKLELRQGSPTGAVLGEATTAGTAIGIQPQQIGPIPTVRGVELHFKETGAGNTNLANYASGYQCTVEFLDGTTQTLDSVPGTAGKITIPQNGEAVTCVFRNSPLKASIDIFKQVTDFNGENPEPATDWDVTANIAATTGTVTNITPANNVAQKTAGSDGKASWGFTFGAANGVAEIGVSETMKDGYSFQNGSCIITSIDGSETTQTLNGAANQDLAGIKPGDRVACTYTNKPDSGTLTLVKEVTGGEAEATEWALTAKDSEGAPVIDGASTATPSATATVPAGDYTLTESDGPDGYQLEKLACALDDENKTPVLLTGDDNVVAVANGQRVICTFTNAPQRVLLTLVKVVEGNEITGGLGSLATNWTLSATQGDTIISGVTGADAVTGAKVSEGTWTLAEAGARAQENLGYDWDRLECKYADGNPIPGVDQDNPAITLAFGDDVTCTFTNTAKLGSVTWKKVDKAGNALAGSQWQIKDSDGDVITASIRENPDGTFNVTGLQWGDYTLTETAAPPGYQLLTDPIEFKIGPDGETFVVSRNLGNIENTMVTGPSLPMTGGQAATVFLLLGGGLLGGALSLAAIKRRRAAH